MNILINFILISIITFNIFSRQFIIGRIAIKLISYNEQLTILLYLVKNTHETYKIARITIMSFI